MSRSAQRFGVSAEQKLLPAFSGTGSPEEVNFFGSGAESEEPAWRLLELGSSDGRPWRARIQWAYATGQMTTAQVDIPSAARVSLFAKSLLVTGLNQANVANRVRVLVSDVPGPIPTRNYLTTHLRTPTNVVVDVPAFAQTAWVDTSDPASPADVSFDDPNNNLIARFTSSGLPSGGVPLALCNRLRVTCAVDCRVVFALAW